jgi:hypothetical protein
VAIYCAAGVKLVMKRGSDVSGPIVLPLRNICAIIVSLNMHLLVVKTVALCYVAKNPVFVTGIVTHVMFLTALIVLKGMLIEFVTVARTPPSVNPVSMCCTSVLSVENHLWSMTTPVARKRLWQICLCKMKKLTRQHVRDGWMKRRHSWMSDDGAASSCKN